MNALTGKIRLDFRSNEPIYGQIVSQIEALVKAGMIKPGDQLPTVRELAIDLRINFSTVARAYRILDEKRLISTQRGRGTYIWENGEQQPGVEESDQEDHPYGDERDDQIRLLARRFLEQARQQGYTIDEVQRAIQQETMRVLKN